MVVVGTRKESSGIEILCPVNIIFECYRSRTVVVSGKLVPSVCLLVGHRLDNSRSTIPFEGGWVSGTLVLRVDGLYSVLD